MTPLPYAFLENFARRVPWLGFPLRYVHRLAVRWEEDACMLMAASLAYFGLLSVFPMALAGVSIFAHLLAGDQTVLRDFSAFVSSFFPGAAGEELGIEIQHAVNAIAGGPDATTLSFLALVSLLWCGRAYFHILTQVLNRIWPGAQPRTFWRHQVFLLGLMVGTGVLFLLSTVATFALSVAQAMALQMPELFINRAPKLWDVATRFSAWALTLIMFYLLYHFGPNRNTPDRNRLVWSSACLAAVAWELAKWGFAHFLGNVARYQATYGSVAGIVVTMLWIYLSNLIVLLGAESAAAYRDLVPYPPKKEFGPEEYPAL